MKKTVTLDSEEWGLFIALAGRLEDVMSNAGCNDFEMDDTPANRTLFDAAEADNVGMTVEEWRASPDYLKPQIHRGKILCADFQVFGYLFGQIKRQVAAEPTDG
jgi:hypothetical protein